jgi:hypothetical protein
MLDHGPTRAQATHDHAPRTGSGGYLRTFKSAILTPINRYRRFGDVCSCASWARCEGATVIKNPQLLLFPIVIVGMIVSGIVGWKRHQKQVAQVRQFATKMGWNYTASDSRWTHISARTPFNSGMAIRDSWMACSATDIVQGAYDQRPVAAFDYTVRSEQQGPNGSTETTYRYGVCVITLPAPLPYLEIGHESVLGRLAQSMGEHDIQIESEGFNRQFRVRSADPKFASDVLSPQLAEKLMSLPAEQWRIEGNNLISWRKGRLDVNTLPTWLSMLSMIVSSIPSFVWHDHGVQGSQVAPVAPVAPQPVAPAYTQQQPTAPDYPQPSYAAAQPTYAGAQYAPQPPAQPDYPQQPAQPEYTQQPAQPEYAQQSVQPTHAQQPASAWPNQNILPGK